MRTLVLGGIRSGKSRWAEDVVVTSAAPDQPPRYLACGPTDCTDQGWVQRIAAHRSRRAGHWTTVETHDIATALRESPQIPTLVDDLGTWLAGTLDRHHGWDGGSDGLSVNGGVEAPVAEVVAAVSEFGSTLVLVSPEVGLTVVPATASGRKFADELGTLNQRVAAVCDQVVLVVAGQALRIKPPSK